MSEHPAHASDPQADRLTPLQQQLDEAAQDVAARMRALRAAAAAAERRAAALEEQLAVAEARLAVETMHAAGLAAQAAQLMAVALEAGGEAVAALTAERPGHNGPTSRLAEIYDTDFDAKAAELGIEEPGRFRGA